MHRRHRKKKKREEKSPLVGCLFHHPDPLLCSVLSASNGVCKTDPLEVPVEVKEWQEGDAEPWLHYAHHDQQARDEDGQVGQQTQRVGQGAVDDVLVLRNEKMAGEEEKKKKRKGKKNKKKTAGAQRARIEGRGRGRSASARHPHHGRASPHRHQVFRVADATEPVEHASSRGGIKELHGRSKQRAERPVVDVLRGHVAALHLQHDVRPQRHGQTDTERAVDCDVEVGTLVVRVVRPAGEPWREEENVEKRKRDRE